MAPTQPDPFDRLGIEPAFRLSRDEIERAALKRLAQNHPDRASGTGAAAHAAAVNDARRLLLNPEARANALLARLGGPAPADSTDLPDGFLQTIMATRLELEDDLDAGDDASLRRWHAWAAEQRAVYIDRVAEAFQTATTPADLAAIRTHLNAWRYIERLLEQLPEPDSRAHPG